MKDAAAVDVVDLRRVYERRSRRRRTREAVTALAGVSLRVAPGEIHGLLGPNGAGKTTLLKILATVLLPTSGRASVLGHDVVHETEAVRRRIGIVFGGDRGLYTRLSARQNLRFWAALHGLPRGSATSRVEELLERLGLRERADDRVETYSRGMKQRVHLARGLLADPAVVFLDEPTTGLDPVAARQFRSLVGDLRGEGKTILLATHDMVEAESVCDRVTLVDRGRILATDSPRALTEVLGRHRRIVVEGVPEHVVAELRALAGVEAVAAGNGTTRIDVAGDAALPAVLGVLVAAGVQSVETTAPTLEEVYVELVGERGLRL